MIKIELITMKSFIMLVLILAFTLPAKSEESYAEEAELDFSPKFERRKRDGVYKCKSGLYVPVEDLKSEKAMQKGDLKLYITKLTKETTDWKTKAAGIFYRIHDDTSIGDPYLFKGYSKHDIQEYRPSVFGFSLPRDAGGVSGDYDYYDYFLYERNGKKLILGGNRLIDSDGIIHKLDSDTFEKLVVCDYPRKGLISKVSGSILFFVESENFPIIIKYSRYTHEGYTDQEGTFSF